MANVRRDVIAGSPSDWASYFSQFVNDSFITVDTTNNRIYIDEEHEFYLYRDYYGFCIYLEGVLSSQATTSSDDTVTIGVSDTLFFLNVHNYIRGDHMYVIAQKINNSLIYYFWLGQQSDMFHPLDYTVDFKDINTSTIYNHKILLSYDVEINKIDYTEDIIYANDSKVCLDPDFITCTSVEPNSVITFNGKNHLVIGTNTLIPIDEQE